MHRLATLSLPNEQSSCACTSSFGLIDTLMGIKYIRIINQYTWQRAIVYKYKQDQGQWWPETWKYALKKAKYSCKYHQKRQKYVIKHTLAYTKNMQIFTKYAFSKTHIFIDFEKLYVNTQNYYRKATLFVFKIHNHKMWKSKLTEIFCHLLVILY